MHGVVEVAFGIPARYDHGLGFAFLVGGSSPDFIVALLGELKGRAPALPGISVLRRCEGGGLPG